MDEREALHALALLARTDERVRVAYSLSGGKSDRMTPESAETGAIQVRTIAGVAEMTGQSVRFTIYRVEDRLGRACSMTLQTEQDANW